MKSESYLKVMLGCGPHLLINGHWVLGEVGELSVTICLAVKMNIIICHCCEMQPG
jgi:hypothetical protein